MSEIYFPQVEAGWAANMRVEKIQLGTFFMYIPRNFGPVLFLFNKREIILSKFSRGSLHVFDIWSTGFSIYFLDRISLV